jgi:hypothetical protein
VSIQFKGSSSINTFITSLSPLDNTSGCWDKCNCSFCTWNANRTFSPYLCFLCFCLVCFVKGLFHFVLTCWGWNPDFTMLCKPSTTELHLQPLVIVFHEFYVLWVSKIVNSKSIVYKIASFSQLDLFCLPKITLQKQFPNEKN